MLSPNLREIMLIVTSYGEIKSPQNDGKYSACERTGLMVESH